MVLQEGEDHARSKTMLCITICKVCSWKKHLLKTLMDGEMASRSHRPTHASIKWMLNKEDTALQMIRGLGRSARGGKQDKKRRELDKIGKGAKTGSSC